MEAFNLTDENDDMANYLILSLQTDQLIPPPDKDESKIKKMEERLLNSMKRFNISRLEMLRSIAVHCEDFIIFLRDKSFGTDIFKWPITCGDIFYTIPIFTPFGTCFTTNKTIR